MWVIHIFRRSDEKEVWDVTLTNLDRPALEAELGIDLERPDSYPLTADTALRIIRLDDKAPPDFALADEHFSIFLDEYADGRWKN